MGTNTAQHKNCIRRFSGMPGATCRALLASIVIFLVSLFSPTIAQSDNPISVVATFSILGDMASRIGGEFADVKTLVGPNGDTHVYQPTPADAQAISEASILIVNGLQFEGWIERLIEASDFEGLRIVAAAGIEPIAFEGEHHDEDHAEDDDHDHDAHSEDDHEHDEHAGRDRQHRHGAVDPHAWLSLDNAVVYVDNITAALAQADPVNAGTFYQNRAVYVDEIKALDSEITELMENLSSDRRTVVTSHDAFRYFGRDYGLEFIAPQGFSTESEASAKDVAGLIRQIRAQGISAVFIENVGNPRLLESISEETGAIIGGKLYPGSLSGPDGPAASYLDLFRHNAITLAQALSK